MKLVPIYIFREPTREIAFLSQIQRYFLTVSCLYLLVFVNQASAQEIDLTCDLEVSETEQKDRKDSYKPTIKASGEVKIINGKDFFRKKNPQATRDVNRYVAISVRDKRFWFEDSAGIPSERDNSKTTSYVIETNAKYSGSFLDINNYETSLQKTRSMTGVDFDLDRQTGRLVVKSKHTRLIYNWQFGRPGVLDLSLDEPTSYYSQEITIFGSCNKAENTKRKF